MANTKYYEVAGSLLTDVQAIFATATTALPDRQYVCWGDPAFDCDQLVVAISLISTGTPNFQVPELRPGHPYTTSVNMRLTLIRCVATVKDDGSPPTAAEIDADAETLASDAAILFDGMRSEQYAGTLYTGCSSVSMGPLTAINPQGGLSGSQCDVIVGL